MDCTYVGLLELVQLYFDLLTFFDFIAYVCVGRSVEGGKSVEGVHIPLI